MRLLRIRQIADPRNDPKISLFRFKIQLRIILPRRSLRALRKEGEAISKSQPELILN